MASKNTGDLFIRIGLDLNAVDQGLVYLNKTLEENIKVLEEKIKQRKLKLDINTGEIDSKLKSTVKNLQESANNATGNILIKAGLDLSEVNKGLVYLNKSVDENVKLAEQKLQQRKLKLNADTSKIDSTTSQGTQEYFKVQYHGLKEIEKLQQQIVKLREAEYKAAIKTSGVDSKETQKALTSKLKAEEQVSKTQRKINESTGYLNATKISELEKYHQKQSLKDSISQGKDAYNANNQWLSSKGNITENATVKETTELLKNQYHELKSIEKLQQQIVKLRETEYRAAVKSSGVDSEKAQKALTSKNAVEKEIAATQKGIKETAEYLKMLGKLEEAEKNYQAKSLREAIQQNRTAYRNNRSYRNGTAENRSISSNAELKIEEITDRFNVFAKLKDAQDIIQGVTSKTIEMFDKIPAPVARAGLAIAGFTAGMLAIPVAVDVAKKLQDTVLELADSAMKAGDALYAASRGAQMSIGEFAEFSRVCKVTGISLSEVTDMSKKMQSALVKVESGMTGTGAASSKFLINNLKNYGIEIRKENGELKNSYEIFKELSAGLQRAQSQGRGKEFLATIGASGDYATALEDLAGNIELEKSIVKNRLADATLAHNTQSYLNALNTQKEQLEGAFSSIFVPVAYDMIPKITEQLGRLTEVINENAEGIRSIAEVAANAAVKITDFGVSLTEAFAEHFNQYIVRVKKNLGIDDEEDLIARLKKEYGFKLREVKTQEEYIKLVSPELAEDTWKYESGEALEETNKALEAERQKLSAKIEQLKTDAKKNLNDADKIFKEKYSNDFERRTAQSNYEIKIKNDLKNEIEEATRLSHLAERTINGNFNLLEDRVNTLGNKLRKEYEQFSKWQNTDDGKQYLNSAEENKEPPSLTDAEKQSRITRMDKIQEELRKIKLDLQYGDDTYGKALAELEHWTQERLQAIEFLKNLHPNEYEEEKNLITERRDASLEQIERERVSKLSAIRDAENAKFQTNLENQLNAISKQKDSWILAGMEEAEAETLAQKLKTKEIQDLNEEFAKSLDSIWQSSLEKRLAEIEREKQAWIQKGIDEVKATQWAEQAKVGAQREAALQVLRSQAEELQAFKEGGYEGLKQLKLDKLLDAGIFPEDLMMTPKQLADFQKAQQMAEKSLLPKFMTSQEQDLEKRWRDFSLYQDQMKLREHHEDPVLPTKLIYDGKDLTEQVLQEYFGLIPKEELSKLPQSVEQVENSFSCVSNAAENLEQKLSELQESILQGGENPELASKFDFRNTETFNDNLSNKSEDFNPIIENLSSTFENFAPIIERLGSYFDEFNSQIITVTEKFSELIDTISNTDTALKNNQSSQQQPTNITNNVSIQEAHAWDYSHIQELAEKVADVITPRILSALGGDSNSY